MTKCPQKIEGIETICPSYEIGGWMDDGNREYLTKNCLESVWVECSKWELLEGHQMEFTEVRDKNGVLMDCELPEMTLEVALEKEEIFNEKDKNNDWGDLFLEDTSPERGCQCEHLKSGERVRKCYDYGIWDGVIHRNPGGESTGDCDFDRDAALKQLGRGWVNSAKARAKGMEANSAFLLPERWERNFSTYGQIGLGFILVCLGMFTCVGSCKRYYTQGQQTNAIEEEEV